MSGNNDGWGGGGDPTGMSNSDSSSGSGSGSLAGAGAGAGALGLAGAGAVSGSGSDSGSFSGSESCNSNDNSNANMNQNTNMTTVSDTVDVTVKAQVSDISGPPSTTDSNDNGSFNTTTTNTTYNIPVTLTDSPLNLADANNFLAGGGDTFSFSGSGTDTAFHVDQVNGLIANNTLSGVTLTNNGDGFSQTSSDVHGGSSIAGGVDHTVGDTVSSSVSSAASATASLSAFTQNIVLGANIQYNSLSQTNTGGAITHSASATDPVTATTTLDPSQGGPGGMGGDHIGH